ncbi:MAG: hypothetical protein IMZ52_05905 [Actinobacteria bacterium]|nr:hypothetical protein [Actinomycetota bacterium]
MSICATILFFLMIVFPQTYQLFKIPLLSVVLMWVISVVLLSGKIKIQGQILLWFLVYLSYGVIWGALGLINGKEYAIDFVRLHVTWVIIYLLLVVMVSKPYHIEKAQKIMIWSALVIAIININYFLYGIGAYHIPFLTTLNMGQAVGIHSGYSQLNTQNIGSLFFLVPFIFSGIAINRGKCFAGFSLKFTTFVLLTCILATFLSGRRMLLIIVALTPIIFIFVVRVSDSYKIKPNQLIKLLIGTIIVLFSILYIFYHKLGWNLQNFVEHLTFSGEYAVGIEYRVNKIREMIGEVYEYNLFFGTGGGSPAFEVTFIQTFHETGIIGLIVNLSLYMWVFIRMLIIIKRRNDQKYQGIPLLVGSVCFFIAMWANPFGSFDFMWTLFLPVAFINNYLRNQSKNG